MMNMIMVMIIMMKLIMITMIIKPVDSGVAYFQANPVVYHRVMYKDTHHFTLGDIAYKKSI